VVLQHCWYEIWSGVFTPKADPLSFDGSGPAYDFQWHVNQGASGAIQLRTTSHAPDESQPGMEQWRYRDMEVVPGDNRVTMVTEGVRNRAASITFADLVLIQ
jgi:hypothetical protein